MNSNLQENTVVKKKPDLTLPNSPQKRTVFDHVKHIRQIQDPKYYVNMSEDDCKNFNHFMIIRALAMDDTLVEKMAPLYRIFDKIPSPQFYQLLISLVPKSNIFCPWIKSRVIRYNKSLLGYIAQRFQISKYQAVDYINILLRSEEGQEELVNILKYFGLNDKEIEKLFEKQKYE
jgi:hypothetical protein